MRWRYRPPGGKGITIKGVYGSLEFAANYRAATQGTPIEKKGLPAKHGTMAGLARSYLRSGEFDALASATQRARRYLIETHIIRGEFGTYPVADLQKRHVKRLFMDPLAKKPGTARNVLSVLRILMALAIEDGIRHDDPTAGIKRPKLSKRGWHAWTEEEVEQYEAKHPIGSQARLGLALAACTSQRAADLIRMGRQHVRNGRISVVQQKTGTPLEIRLHPDLKVILDATPSEHLTFLVSEKGKPFASANSFGHRMRKWAKEAGLIGCPLHGLRKVCLRRLAELGCTAPEIMSVSGHKSMAEVQHYIETANQKRMADRAIARTESYPRDDQSYPQEKKA
ncbi:MAG: tyrosine-type recombinase/integrase [Methyloceanibacter sp.]